MALTVDENGNLTITQGDTGTLVVGGLDTSKNYKVYFAIQNKKREAVGDELIVSSNNSDTVVFKLTGDLTDLLTVPEKSKTETYYYGIKLCSVTDNTEDTLVVNNGDMGDTNIITVYPKKVEGI